MNPNMRLFAAVLLAGASALSHAESVVAKIARGSLAREVASRQGLKLQGVTPDGRYARFGLPVGSNASVLLRRLRLDKGLSSADLDTKLRTVQYTDPRPTLIRKGSTIPVVGDRTSLRIANADLLRQMNWDVDLANAWGRPIRVALLDTGLGYNATSLWNKTVASENFIEAGSAWDRPTNDDSSGNGIPDEGTGHGTVVAGIVDMVSPRSQFVVARIADSDGMASTWTLIQGLRFAIDNRAEVINISLAQRKRISVVELLLAEAEAKGIVVVASIGNDNDNMVYEPADFGPVIAVSAVDLSGRKANFSNYHIRTLVAAPGTSVVGRCISGNQVQWAGTSFSAAFVSGAITDTLRRRWPARPSQVRSALRWSCENIDNLNPSYPGQLGRLLDFRRISWWLGAGW